jgi:uncharacterized protein (TIGR02246 family)
VKRIDRALRRGYASAAALLAVLAWPAEGWSRQRTCPTREQIVRLFDHWNDMLQKSASSKDPRWVVGTYTADAILVPTCTTSGPLVGRDDIAKYFSDFIKKNPVGQINERRIYTDDPDCNIAFDTGLYTFEVNGDPPTVRVPLQARYTFVYRRQGNSSHWLIAHQHSSVRRQSDAGCLPPS